MLTKFFTTKRNLKKNGYRSPHCLQTIVQKLHPKSNYIIHYRQNIQLRTEVAKYIQFNFFSLYLFSWLFVRRQKVFFCFLLSAFISVVLGSINNSSSRVGIAARVEVYCSERIGLILVREKNVVTSLSFLL